MGESEYNLSRVQIIRAELLNALYSKIEQKNAMPTRYSSKEVMDLLAKDIDYWDAVEVLRPPGTTVSTQEMFLGQYEDGYSPFLYLLSMYRYNRQPSVNQFRTSEVYQWAVYSLFSNEKENVHLATLASGNDLEKYQRKLSQWNLRINTPEYFFAFKIFDAGCQYVLSMRNFDIDKKSRMQRKLINWIHFYDYTRESQIDDLLNEYEKKDFLIDDEVYSLFFLQAGFLQEQVLKNNDAANPELSQKWNDALNHWDDSGDTKMVRACVMEMIDSIQRVDIDPVQIELEKVVWEKVAQSLSSSNRN